MMVQGINSSYNVISYYEVRRRTSKQLHELVFMHV